MSVTHSQKLNSISLATRNGYTQSNTMAQWRGAETYSQFSTRDNINLISSVVVVVVVVFVSRTNYITGLLSYIAIMTSPTLRWYPNLMENIRNWLESNQVKPNKVGYSEKEAKESTTTTWKEVLAPNQTFMSKCEQQVIAELKGVNAAMGFKIQRLRPLLHMHKT